MNLRDKISEDLKVSMKAQDKFRTGVLRMVLSEIKYAQAAVGMHNELDPAAMEKAVSGYHKKLVKSLEDYPEGDKRTTIQNEIKIVEAYLPKKLDSVAIEKIVDDVLAKTSDRNFGALMKQVMAATGPAADGKTVSEIIKRKIST